MTILMSVHVTWFVLCRQNHSEIEKCIKIIEIKSKLSIYRIEENVCSPGSAVTRQTWSYSAVILEIWHD